MANVPIGYYVHHDGSGHMMRALAIVQKMTVPVVLFSSREPYEALPSHVTFVKLPDDEVSNYSQPPDSLFLYTPYSDVIFKRYQQLIAVIQRYGIRAIYVDVSPEVALVCKLLGLTVGHAVMHGNRIDRAHSLLYDAADLLLSHNSSAFDNQLNRRTQTKVQYSGGISRLPTHETPRPIKISRILITVSRAESGLRLDDIMKSAYDFPHIEWDVIGAIHLRRDMPNNINIHGVIDNIIPFYNRADLVIGSGGNNTIMEAASQRKPFLCIPEDKPFNEQVEAASKLAKINAAFYEPTWPNRHKLQKLLDTYDSLDLDAFYALVDESAPRNAARIIQSLPETSPL